VLNARKYIDVVFNDVTVWASMRQHHGFDGFEFKLLRGTTDVTSELGTVTTTRLSGTTVSLFVYRLADADAEYAVEFQPDSWRDNAAYCKQGVEGGTRFVSYIRVQDSAAVQG